MFNTAIDSQSPANAARVAELETQLRNMELAHDSLFTDPTLRAQHNAIQAEIRSLTPPSPPRSELARAQSYVWGSRAQMRELIDEIRRHGTYKVHGLRGLYPELFRRAWTNYRTDMAELSALQITTTERKAS